MQVLIESGGVFPTVCLQIEKKNGSCGGCGVTTVQDVRAALSSSSSSSLSSCCGPWLAESPIYSRKTSRILADNDNLCEHQQENSVVFLRVQAGRLLGGKGGFGALLRGQNAKPGQKKIVDSNSSCRDLSGRRVRHAENERLLAEWKAKTGEREKAKLEEKQAKLDAIPKITLQDVDMGTEHMERVVESVEEGIREAQRQEAINRQAREEERKRAAAAMAGGIMSALSDDDESDAEEEEAGAGKNSNKNKSGAKVDASSSKGRSREENGAGAAGGGGDEDGAAHRPSKAARTHSPERIVGGAAAHVDKEQQPPQPPQPAQPAPSQEQEAKQQAAAAPAAPAAPAPPAIPDVDVDACASVADLEALGGDALKHALTQRGLKCGGTVHERAVRLFSVRGKKWEEIDAKLKAQQAAPPQQRK